jgi:hypothetical protein
MKSALTNDPSQECYVVEIDSSKRSSTDPLVFQRIHILLDPRMANKPEFNWNVQPDGRQTQESF